MTKNHINLDDLRLHVTKLNAVQRISLDGASAYITVMTKKFSDRGVFD